ncbi:hypothetical protein ACFE04_025264 [Oxalis oulophora]
MRIFLLLLYKCCLLIFLLISVSNSNAIEEDPQLSSARVVFQTNYGDIEFGFYPSVAPITVDHIFKLVRLGCYNTNHFFRVDKGFVAQVADVVNGRSAPWNDYQSREARKTIVGEFSDVKHVRGILSMGRHADPNSGGSSFSILLGNAPHLDRQYAIFGKVTKGDETLQKLEQLPTRREGIFVMGHLHGNSSRLAWFWPYFLSSYVLSPLPMFLDGLLLDSEMESCEKERPILRRRLAASFVEIERQRMKCFP